jgi:[protein-PII] uridylyltransferase
MLQARSALPDAVGTFLQRRKTLDALLDERESAGLPLARQHSALADSLLLSLFQNAQGRARSNAPVSLFAVGSHGRSLLGLKSDLDVLFVTSGSASEIGPLVDSVLYPLWDAGVTIGHQVMRVEDLLQNAKEALQTATALLDIRLLAGSESLSRALQERAFAELFSGAGLTAFLDRVRREVEERWRRFGDSVYLLEPDVKNGAGGLRDADVVRWTARAGYAGASMPEIVRAGGLTEREVEALQSANDFFYRVRNHLHYAAGRRNDRLTFDQQEYAATRMGYQLMVPPPQGSSPEELIGPTVEAFMSDYYQHARAVTRAQEQVLARVHERMQRGSGRVKRLGNGIISLSGQLGFESAELVTENPALALQLYLLAVERNQPVMHSARDLIMRLTSDDPEFGVRLRSSPETAKLFTELLCSTRQAPFRNGSILGELHAVGLLLAVIPEFAPVVGRVHHDLYHVYTVDVHSVAAVDRVRALMRGELVQRHALGCRLAAEYYKPDRLLFAVLLHDIGKVFGGKEHSIRGAAMARAILARFNLDAVDIELCSKLILHHLTMYFVAARRDLADPTTIEQFAAQVGDQDFLRSLYLLTIADISTTAPDSMTSWKSRMLDELYTLTDRRLGGTSETDPMTRARADLYAQTAGLVEPQVLDALLSSMPERYVLANTPAEIAAHAHVINAARGKRVHLQIVPSRHTGVNELCVVTVAAPEPETRTTRPGLLAAIAAALTACRLEIFAAQIYTRLAASSGEEVLDVFWVRDRVHGADGLTAIIPKVERMLDDVLSGAVTPQNLLLKRTPTRWSDRPCPPVPTEIAVENRSSDKFTIIEVITQDKPGVLFTLSHTLHQLGLSIVFAKVNTEGNRVIDIFYVTELNETKLGSRERVNQVKLQLAAALHRRLPGSS